MKNKIEDLRNHLFEQLERLKDCEDLEKEIERAKAVANVASVVVDSAKAEVEFMRVAGAKNGTGFVPLPAQATAAPASALLPVTNGGRSYNGGRRTADASQ